MKQLRHVLALTLVFCMVFGMVTPSLAVSGEISVEEDNGIPVEEDSGIEIEVDDRGFDIDEDREETSVLPKQDETADTNADGDGTYKYNIIHLDCGRKYFSVDSIKQIIDNASEAGFNYIQLAVGNDGMRFLLDDMDLTLDDGTEYDGTAITAAIKAANKAYYDAGTYNELTQDEMDTIIAYAKTKGMGVIPLINTPGHMDAILAAANKVTGVDCAYDGSARTINVEKSEATEFTKAFLKKYIEYFKGKGCMLFNMGADEYANDVYKTGSMGFGNLQNTWNYKYNYYVDYVNEVAALIKSKGMTPVAFNDGIYFRGDTNGGTFDTDIIIEYWSCGWDPYLPMPASDLAAKGFKMINTNGDCYYVLKDNTIKCDISKINSFEKTAFMGSTVSDPVGSTFCIWCDEPSVATEDTVVSTSKTYIDAFGARVKGYIDNGGTTDPTEPTEKTVTVTVGGTETINLDGDVRGTVNTDDLKTAVATVDVDYNQVEGSTTRELGSKINLSNATITGVITDGNENYVTLDSSGTLSSTTSREKATVFTFIPTQDKWNQYNYSYAIKYDGYYLYMTDNNKLGVSEKSITSWYYSYYNGLYAYSSNYYAYYLSYSDNDWALIRNSSSSTRAYPYSFTDTKTDPVNTTVITITGKTVGTTYITVGNVRYTINVIKEDLTKVTPITVEYWITNSRLTGKTSGNDSLTITAAQAYGEYGVDISTLVDAKGAKDGREQEYWQSKILDTTKTNESTSGTELQTTKQGDDETLNGSAFTKIRYYESKWQVYTTKWTDVNRTQVSFTYTGDNSTTVTYSGDTNQLVAYYMEVVNINNTDGKSELHVNAADWGTKCDGTGSWGYPPEDYRCSVSVQIVYEDGSTNPSDTTAANLKSKTIMYGYWSGGRGLGTMIFNGQQNYQIYKVTAETGDVTSTTGSGNTVTVTKFDWDDNEETVWEGDATKSVSIGNPARKPSYVAPYDNLAWNTSAYNNNNAILIRVYVKAVATEDALTVHYVDKGTGTNFYNYNILVAEGTKFDEGFALDSNSKLVNNTVINYNGITQTVNSDLKKMPEISSYYRFSDFELVEVVRSEDGKEVWLYYTFNNTHNFVVDFGVALHLEPADIGIDTSAGTTWDTATLTTGNTILYGKAEIEAGRGLTYTPTKVMSGVETIAIDLSDSTQQGADPATHFIYLYPATNVLYEEDVLTEAASDKYQSWKREISTTAKQQEVEKLGAENVHGYDLAYASDKTFSADSYYHATLNAGEFTKDLTFTFTGTGFDVISECGPQTGVLLVAVKNSEGKTVKLVFVDTLFNGDENYIISDGKDILDYQVPVYRNLGLDHGTYTVEITGVYMNRPAATASATSLYSNDTYSLVRDMLDARGYYDVDVDDVELVYMDENSVLNGGTGVVSGNAVAAFSANLAEEYAVEPYADSDSETQDVYVDGIRIYGTLAKDPGYATAEAGVKYDSVYEFAKNSAVDFDTEIGEACIYVEYDGAQDVYNIADYRQQGPENEVYLTPGSGIAFQLNNYVAGMTVQVSAKTIATTNGDKVAIDLVTDENGSEVAALVDFKNTSTEMYYKVNVISDGDIYYVLIVNNVSSTGILSLSDVKVNSAIKACITPELKTVINNDKEANFVPDTFEISYIAGMENVTLGDTIQVSSKLSYLNKNNVETKGLYVVVTSKDGTVIVQEKQLKASNAKAVERGKTNIYKFNYALFTGIKNVPITTAGEYKLTFYAKDTNGNESGKLVFNVNVAASEN